MLQLFRLHYIIVIQKYKSNKCHVPSSFYSRNLPCCAYIGLLIHWLPQFNKQQDKEKKHKSKLQLKFS